MYFVDSNLGLVVIIAVAAAAVTTRAGRGGGEGARRSLLIALSLATTIASGGLDFVPIVFRTCEYRRRLDCTLDECWTPG